MVSLNCDFEFDFIDPNFENVNNQNTLLWILHADKVPPHIGISVNGFFFSLKVRGKDEFLPINKFVNILNSKKILTVAVELNIDLLLDEVANKYDQFDFAKDLESSCLVPIKELLLSGEKIERLKDLLDILREKKLMNKVFGLNLTESYKGIPFYTTEQIELRLEKLRYVEG
ncbi:MAG: hypothetical protein FJZ67_06380 [Bacteroidetes bacterium]|nr:hypothetical protein [Bacteroidota bacterium]